MPTPVDPAPRHRGALVAALVAYGVFLALVLGWPTPVDAPARGALRELLERLHDAGVSEWVSYAKIEFGANIALFVPVGLLVALAVRRGQRWLAVLAGFGLSFSAELAQGLLREQRVSSLRDVVANTLGTLIGVGIAALVVRRRGLIARTH